MTGMEAPTARRQPGDLRDMLFTALLRGWKTENAEHRGAGPRPPTTTRVPRIPRPPPDSRAGTSGPRAELLSASVGWRHLVHADRQRQSATAGRAVCDSRGM